MKAAVRRCGGGVPPVHCMKPARGSPWTRALPLASTAALVGAQVRAKHYISYRLEGEDDPYRHLRRRKSSAKKKQQLRRQQDEELLMGEAEEEASRSSSSLASFLFGPTTQLDDEVVSQRPVEAATSQRDTELASGMGTGGGVVHRSKGAMPFRRPSFEGGVGGQSKGGEAGQAPQPQAPREPGGGEDRSRAMMADRPRVEGEDHEPMFWLPQSVPHQPLPL